ncbi:MAG: molybdopterin molybdotransferase MoeA [Rhodospirillales bacterium]|nr:molybdopterin molybdotransferase MoeA [Rhodospirillales bacterium]MCW9039444.1 molybdopterin molybdotransferase MoeA [Rhodospirillales bacterium]
MISVAEAFEKVTGGVARLPSEVVGIENALGRVLAEDVASRVTQPPVAVSSMDGYAVRAIDITAPPVKMNVSGESAAGSETPGTLSPGTAIRIFTGAPVPEGADAVVMQEDTKRDGDSVIINVSVNSGNFIRPAGMDFSEGEVLLRTGKVMTARDIGLAAAMNVPWLRVTRKPRIAILATGNEVVMPGEAKSQNQIFSSNSLSLAAQVTALGGEPINLGIARDDEDSLHLMASGAKGADMLVTIGGASVGDYDLVRKVLGEDGLELGFYKVAMRPGKPLIFGMIEGTPMIGVPGNPVSANVTAALFLRAAMEVMLGIDGHHHESHDSAILGHDLDANDQRQDYLRARLETDANGQVTAIPFDKQDSALLARLAEADCLIIRPPHAEAAKKGEIVPILRMRHGLVSI